MDTVAVILALREWAQGSAEVCDTHRDGGPCEQLATALAMRFDALEAALDGLLDTERARLAATVERAAQRADQAAEAFRHADGALLRRASAGNRELQKRAEAAMVEAGEAMTVAEAALEAFDKEAGR